VNTTTRLRLKQPSGWFAAGREIHRAATSLTDATFKIFVWLCLHAERASGTVNVSLAAVARDLGKDEAEVERGVQELIESGVCCRRELGQLEVLDPFWPYERVPRAGHAEPAYVTAIATMLRRYKCVHCLFTPADQRLASQWCREGVTLERVSRAILLGVLRKYVMLLNHGKGSPITSLSYFQDLIREVDQPGMSSDYWTYSARKLHQLEQRWIAQHPPFAHTLGGETK
jgi:Helix-turn-helix domain